MNALSIRAWRLRASLESCIAACRTRVLKDFTTRSPMQGRPFSDLGAHMPLSREPLRDDQLIRHLLGTLPEDEAKRVEEESIVDDEIAARLQVAEDDLVDA